MKRLITLLSISVCGFSQVYPFEYKGLAYEVISESEATCRITGYDNLSEYTREGKLTLPSKVENGGSQYKVISIGRNGLSNVEVDDIVLPETLVELEENSLACTSASIIHLPESLRVISDYALQSNTSLQAVTIPSKIEEFGKGIFRGCSSLEKVIINSAITSIPDYTFSDCVSLTNFDSSELILSVGERAFDGCSCLTEFDFSGLERMGERAFAGCSSFTDIRITSRLETISAGAFEHCSSLHTFVAGKYILDIGSEAFSCCSSLSQIELGSSLENIDTRAFTGCKAIKRIYSVNVLPPTLHYDSFENVVYSSASLLVRSTDRDRYLLSPVWMDFKNIVACEVFPLQVENIGTEEKTLEYNITEDGIAIRNQRLTVVCSSDGKLLYSGIPAEDVLIKLSGKKKVVYLSDGLEQRGVMLR